MSNIGQTNTYINPLEREISTESNKRTRKLDISERKIATWLVANIPIEYKHQATNSEVEKASGIWGKAMTIVNERHMARQVDYVAQEIRQLPDTQKSMLTASYIFSCKVPKQERQDVFQWIYLQLLEAQEKRETPMDEKLIYTVARCTWIDWYRGYKTKSQYHEIDIENEAIQDMGVDNLSVLRKTVWNDGLPEVKDTLETEINTRMAETYQKHTHREAENMLISQLEYELLDDRLSAQQLLDIIPDDIIQLATKRMAGIALATKERVKLCRFLKANPDLVMQYQQG